jgi:hypothetical protein
LKKVKGKYFAARAHIGENMHRVHMYSPGFTRSGDSLTKLLREDRDSKANYWFFHSNKLDKLLLLESDVVFACAVMFELQPEVVSYGSVSTGTDESQDDDTKFDFVVKFRDGHVEYCCCRRNAPRSGWKLSAPAGAAARRVTGEDIEKSLYLFDNALMLSGAMTATRNYDRSLAYQAVLQMFSDNPVVTVRAILDVPDFDPALLQGALAQLLADGTLVTDLSAGILTPLSEVRRPEAETSFALPGALASEKGSQDAALSTAEPKGRQPLAFIERTRRRLIPAEYMFVDWPTPELDEIPADEQAVFKRRKDIVEAYRAGKTCKVIAKKFEVQQSQVAYFVSRCLTPRPGGGIYGYYGLLKGKHLNRRTIKTTKPGKGAGSRGSHQWTRLLDRVEGLKSFFLSRLLGQDAPSEGIAFDLSKIYGDVALYLIKAGLGPADYPFSNADDGRDAVARYCRTLAQRYAPRYIEIYHGDTAAKRARQVGHGLRRIIRPLRPGSYGQLDYWRTDKISNVSMSNGHGQNFQVNLPKWYYALLVDEESSAVLSGFPTLEITPSTDSLLECMDRFVHPEQYAKSEFYGDDGITAGPCFAPELVPTIRHKRFDVIRFDNASCNLSETSIRANVYHFGAAINFGPCYTWVTRAVVERVIGNVARLTGKALGAEYSVPLGTLKLAVDRACREHNQAPTERARHSSPVEALAHALDADLARQLPIPLPRKTVEGSTLLDYFFVRPVRGEMKSGTMPYVQELGYRFGSTDLSMETALLRSKGQPVQVSGTIKRYDARICYVRIHEGKSLRLLPDRKQDELISVRHATSLSKAGKRHKAGYTAKMAIAAAQERQRALADETTDSQATKGAEAQSSRSPHDAVPAAEDASSPVKHANGKTDTAALKAAKTRQSQLLHGDVAAGGGSGSVPVDTDEAGQKSNVVPLRKEGSLRNWTDEATAPLAATAGAPRREMTLRSWASANGQPPLPKGKGRS